MFDGAHAGAAENRRERAPHDVAIGEHVGDAGRTEIVLKHDEDAVLAPHQIGCRRH